MRVLHALLLSLLAAAQLASQTPSRIAVTHVTLIDVRDGSTSADMTVLVLGDRISAIGPSTDTRLPKQAHVVDGRGQFLIPGLWDMHVHTDGDARALRLLLASGITGVRDMGGDVAKLAESRRGIVTGQLAGPRLLFAGPMLKGPPAEADRDVMDSTVSSFQVSFERKIEMRISRLAFPVIALLLVTALVSPPLVHAQTGKLEILKAVYGKEGMGQDVTGRLQKLIKNNTLDVKVTNITMGGDPNKSADKTLKVDYTYRGQRKQVVVKEGDRLTLP